ALASWRTRERDDEPRRGGRRLSRGAERTDARACAARVGQDAGQSGHYVCAARRTRERDGKARRGCRRPSRGAERTNERAQGARVPLEWAGGQNNLGIVLVDLGSRESGTAKLEEAVALYREALKEQTRERVPLEWARTQNNLAIALERLGRRESGTAKLDEAVA